MKLFRTFLLLAVACLSIAACATRVPAVPAGTPCETGNFVVTDNFAAARRGTCTVLSQSTVLLEIRREDERVVNPSPWFAFRIEPSRKSDARILLDYGTWEHRYAPKVSYDGEQWRMLSANRIDGSPGDRRIELRLALNDKPVWIAAQEIVTPPDFLAWTSMMTSSTVAQQSTLGHSVAGQAIDMLESPGDSRNIILLTGRQHPPEVSGSYAFFAFVETLFGDSPLAVKFREQFRVIAIPILNPDGVNSGHWRHNYGAKDLNRDWGPFTQPETRLVAKLLDELDQQGNRIRVFIDFHSTKRNLFYTQADEDITEPSGFTERWLENSWPRLTNYEFTNEKRPTSETANGKNYMYKRYGVPSLTYEVGDETTREDAAAAARVFAEELMKLLLSGTPARNNH